MVRSLLMITILVIGLNPLSVKCNQASAVAGANIEDLSVRAQQALSRGDYANAEKCYREILKRNPELAEIRTNLGLTYHLMGRYEQATREFGSALAEDPKLYTANLFLGLDLLQLRKPEKALFYLRQAANLRRDSAEAALALARAYHQLHDAAKAVEFFDQALQKEPQNADAWYGMGLAYLELEKESTERLSGTDIRSPFRQALLADVAADEGRADEAIPIYKDLLNSSSPSPEPYLHSRLGYAYLQREDLPGAREQFQAELARHPGCLAAKLGEARIDLDYGDLSKALERITEISATDHNFFKAYIPGLWLSWNVEKVNAFENSLKHLSGIQEPRQTINDLIAALERWKKEPLNYFANFSGDWGIDGNASSSQRSAERFYSQGGYTACTQILRPHIAVLQSNDLRLLSQCSFYAGAFQVALQASNRLLAVSPGDQAALFWKARAGEVLAVAALARVGLLEPDSAHTHFLLGRALEGRGHLKEAKDEYEKVIQADPQNPAGHLALAEMAVNNMDFSQALPEIQTVLAHDSDNAEASFLMSTILIYQHRYKESLPFLKAALHGPASSLPKVHAFIGKVYASEGHTSEAIQELNQALAADDDGSVHYQLFLLYKKLGNTAAAETALRDSNTIRKENALKARERVTP